MYAQSDKCGFPRQLRFIQDEPAEQDFFQTHTRLANAIAIAIRTNPKTRVIGLLGKWGSGKSTVIRYLTDQLQSSAEGSNIRVFTYDAWLHQHDPVRRSFLENLFEYLIANGHAKREEWKDEIDALKGALEKSFIESTPTFAPGGKLILFSLLLLPVAMALLGLDTIKDAFGEDRTKAGLFSFWISMGLFVLPMTLFLHRWWVAKDDQEADKILSLFMNKSVETNLTTTKKGPEPSAIEFRQTFRRLMQDATKDGKRFIFVIDNLDRIDETDALQIWATIRGFFLAINEDITADAGAAYQPTVVLPIDRSSLKRLFDAADSKDVERVLASFIDKTFDMSFEVPPPVMSDWRAFIAQQAGLAFGFEAADPQVYWLQRFYDSRVRAAEPVTPRQINKLINRVVALCLQWQGEAVSFESICFYAVNADKIDTSGLLDFLTSSSNAVVPHRPEWQQELSALHYGVQPQKAAQVLLTGPLEGAISGYQAGRFAELSTLAGFPEVLQRLVEEYRHKDRDEGDFLFVSNLARLLLEVTEGPSVWMREVWRSLVSLYLESPDNHSFYEDFSARLEPFYGQIEDSAKGRFATRTAEKLGIQISKDRNLSEIAQLRTATERLVAWAIEAGLEPPMLEVSLDPPIFFNRLINFYRAAPSAWPILRWNRTADDAATALIEMLTSPPRHATVPLLVEILREPEGEELFADGTTIDWTGVIKAASGAARDPRSANVASPTALETLGLLLGWEDASDALTALIEEGHVASRLGESVAAEAYGDAAKITALLIWSGTEFAAPGQPWQDIIRSRPEFAKEVHLALRRFILGETMYPLWKSYSKSPPSRPLLRMIMLYQIETDSLGEIDAKHVLNNIGWYLTPLPSDRRRRFVRMILNDPNFWDAFSNIDDDAVFLKVAELITWKRSPVMEQAMDVWRARLKSLSGEKGANAVEKGGAAYNLAFRFIQKGGGKISKEWPIFAALESIASKLPSASADVRRRWFTLAGLCTSAGEQSLLRSLGAVIRSGTEARDLPGLLDLRSGVLAKAGGFENDTLDTVNNVILPLTNSKAGQAWLDRSHLQVRAWLRNSRAPARRALADRFSALQKSRGQVRYWAEAMSARLLSRKNSTDS